MSSQCNKLDKSLHYYVDCNRVITAKELHAVIPAYFKKYIRIKRIRKTAARYIRLSIDKSVSQVMASNILKNIEKISGIKLKKQIPKRNIVLEHLSKGKVPKNLKLLTLNINGCLEKEAELNMLLSRFKPDIVCLQETRRTANAAKLSLNDYKIYETPAGAGSGLGLLIGIKHKVALDLRFIQDGPNYQFFDVVGPGVHYKICNIYKSHNRDRGSGFMEIVANLIKKAKDTEKYIFVGDWNNEPSTVTKVLARKGCTVYASGAPKGGTRTTSRRRRTSKPIDFAISNNPTVLLEQKVKITWRLSDHLPVLVTLDNVYVKRKTEKVTVFDRKLLMQSNIARKIKKLNCLNLIEQQPNINISEAIKMFHEHLNAKLKKLKILREEKVTRNVIVIPKKVKAAIKQKRKIDLQVSNGQASLDQLREAVKRVKEETRKAKQKAYLRFIKQGILHLRANDSRRSWQWLKSHAKLKNKGIANTAIYRKNSRELETDPAESVKIWADHFGSLCKAPDTQYPVRFVTTGKYADVTDSEITWSELSSVLKSLKNNKAAGIDLIPSEVYKLVSNEIIPTSNFAKSLLNLINKVYKGNCFPSNWSDCIVVPIPKKGDLHDVNNYRGISLINTLLKVLCKVLATRLQTVCTDRGLIKKEQSGFITREECLSQAVSLYEVCQRRKIRGKNTVLCFLDLKKAYDLVPHNKLLDRLNLVGLGSRFINFISMMYNNTSLRVRLGNQVSEPVKYKRGVRQGCPTSPLLFNIYIDSLLDNISPIDVEGLPNGLRGLLFAVDTVIAANDRNELKDKLNHIKDWMLKNEMEINPSKCGVMEINCDPNTPMQAPVLYNNVPLPNVDNYVYLGVKFNRHLDLAEMAKFRINVGQSTLISIKGILSNTKVPLEYKRMLIHNILLPRLTFGCELFGMSIIRGQGIKAVTDNAIKCIVKSKNFCRMRAYRELDIVHPYVQMAAARARAFSKWFTSRGVIGELQASGSNFKSRKKTWITQTRTWLKGRGCTPNLETRQLVKEVKEKRLADLQRQDNSAISSFAQSAQIYSGKTIRLAEINDELPTSGILALLKIRTGNFKLTKHYVNLGVLDRAYLIKCPFCAMDISEDLWHFIFECVTFSYVRNELDILNGRVVSRDDPMSKHQLAMLLGGARVVSPKKLPRETRLMVLFLSRVLPRRYALIAERSGPARSTAQM